MASAKLEIEIVDGGGSAVGMPPPAQPVAPPVNTATAATTTSDAPAPPPVETSAVKLPPRQSAATGDTATPTVGPAPTSVPKQDWKEFSATTEGVKVLARALGYGGLVSATETLTKSFLELSNLNQASKLVAPRSPQHSGSSAAPPPPKSSLPTGTAIPLVKPTGPPTTPDVPVGYAMKSTKYAPHVTPTITAPASAGTATATRVAVAPVAATATTAAAPASAATSAASTAVAPAAAGAAATATAAVSGVASGIVAALGPVGLAVAGIAAGAAVLKTVDSSIEALVTSSPKASQGLDGLTSKVRKLDTVMLPAGYALNRFVDFAQSMTEHARHLAQYSGPLSAANAMTDIREQKSEMNRAQEMGPLLAKFENDRSKASAAMYDIGTSINKTLLEFYNLVRPFVTTGIKILEIISENISGGLATLHLIWNTITRDHAEAAKNWQDIIKHGQRIAQILEGDKKLDDPFDDPYTDAFLGMFASQRDIKAAKAQGSKVRGAALAVGFGAGF